MLKNIYNNEIDSPPHLCVQSARVSARWDGEENKIPFKLLGGENTDAGSTDFIGNTWAFIRGLSFTSWGLHYCKKAMLISTSIKYDSTKCFV